MCRRFGNCPTVRKIVKTYSVRQKLCSRIVVQYQQSADFSLMHFFKPCFLPYFFFFLQFLVSFEWANKQNEEGKKSAQQDKNKVHFQYCLWFLFRLFIREVICLLKICNFWNYYFICIVWSHRTFFASLSRPCDRQKVSNLTNHFEYFSINIVGKCLSYLVCLSWVVLLIVGGELQSTPLTISVIDKREDLRKMYSVARQCQPKVILLTINYVFLLQNKSTKAGNWQNKTAKIVNENRDNQLETLEDEKEKKKFNEILQKWNFYHLRNKTTKK